MTARRCPLGALLAVAVLMAGTVPPAVAASGSGDKKKRQAQIGSQIQSLQDQVEEASAEEGALLGQIDASRSKLAGLDAAVADLDDEVAAAQRDLARAQSRSVQQDQALEAAQGRAAAAVHQYDQARVDLKQQVIAAYVDDNADDVSSVLLDIRSQRDIAAAEGYTDAILSVQQNVIDRVDQAREDAAAAAVHVAAARDDAHRQRDAVAAQERALQSERDRQADARAKAVAENAHQGQLLDEIQSKKSEFEGQIAGLKAESDQIESFLRALPSGSGGGAGAGGIVVSGHGMFSLPIAGAPITSGFGSRVHPIFHTVRMHTGLDFGAGEGTQIRAGADGTVVKAGVLGGYGNATVIDHGQGLATLYGHQSRILVHEGQQVKRGEVIGLVGHTGFATGPHLHFEVRVNGTPVDPRTYL